MIKPGVHIAPNRSKTLVMGILNVTPDSFFDGGKWSTRDNAVDQARQMRVDGAGIVDIGGESTRPGAAPVAPDEECRRILPVIEKVAPERLPLSVDTRNASTARRALDAGAAMINDITALRGDPGMATLVAEAGCPVVLMHMQGEPETMQQSPRYDDVVDDIRAFFEERLTFAVNEGVREENIWLDPGFGFGKSIGHNLAILRRLNEFLTLGRPILVGASNKSTIGAVLNAPVDDRTEGTAATVAISIHNGAAAVRVHDVRRMARVARMTDAIIGRGYHG